MYEYCIPSLHSLFLWSIIIYNIWRLLSLKHKSGSPATTRTSRHGHAVECNHDHDRRQQRQRRQADNDNKAKDRRCCKGLNSNGESTNSSISIVERKDEFLKSNHGRVGYGYKSSKRGHIDTWRKREFPGLVHPILIAGGTGTGVGAGAGAGNTNASTCNETAEIAAVGKERSSSTSTSSKIIADLEVYLDYAGSSIPSLSLLNNIHSLSSKYQILANPHSSGIAAARSKEGIEITKKKLLDFFHAQPGPLCGFQSESNNKSNNNDDNSRDGDYDYYHPGYDIIFTSGATEAMRIVAENFQWTTTTSSTADAEAESTSSSSIFMYPMNSHTSVVGMRECALAKGASFRCVKESKLFSADCNKIFHEWTSTSTSKSNTSNNTNTDHHHNPDYNRVDSCETKNDNQCDDQLLPNRYGQDGKKSDNIKDHKATNKNINHLLVLPLECNFSGSRPNNYAKDIIKSSRSCNSSSHNLITTPPSRTHKWYTMLDIAKAACTQSINLKRIDPDFACVSFYKIFGCPTGIGALFIKRSSMHVLLPPPAPTPSPSPSLPNKGKNNKSNKSKVCVFRNGKEKERRYFGGGAVDIVLPGTDFVSLRSSSSNNGSNNNSDLSPSVSSNVFVGGTMNFRTILSLQPCIDEIYSIGGMEQIAYHTKSLALEAVRRLQSLQHRNGRSAIIIYGSWPSICTVNSDNKIIFISHSSDGGCSNATFETMVEKLPGPTIAFNIIRHDGSYVGYNEVAKLASLYKHPIQLRTGCFCNPGACQEALELTDDDVKQNFLQSGHVCGDEIDIINGKPTGAIRMSFGKDSIWEDLDSLIVFLEKTYVSYCRSDTCKDEELISSEASLQKEVTLSEMYIYPIKSCAAMRVSKWKMNRKTAAFQYDREFALVDSSGSALRLSTYPKMGLIRPSIDLDKETLVVKGDGFADLVIDLGPSSCINPMSREIKVCGNRCGGTLWGSHAVSTWFSSFLGVQCWLARYNGTAYVYSPEANGGKQISSYLSNRKANTVVRTGFENEAPILLISQHSVNLLNRVLAKQGSKPVNSKYFRPNFVVDVPIRNTSSISNPEDSWSKILVPSHDLTLTMIGQCARCSMVDIDPASGSKGGKTLRALAEYRRENGRINFGIFMKTMNEDNTFFDDNQKEALIEEGEKLLIKC